jgi:hypothetical protein
MGKLKLLASIIVVLTVCISAGCARYFYCCPRSTEVLKLSEAESISGVGMTLAYDIRDSRGSSCAYVNGRTGDDLHSVVLDLHRFEEGGGPSNEASHRGVAAKYLANVENISGLGDSAFLTQDGSEVFVYARKETLGLQIRAKSVLPPNEAWEKLLAVARRIIARLEES